MRRFPDRAIRERLAAGYRRENRKHGRGVIDVDAAIKDVGACLAEIDALRAALTTAGMEPAWTPIVMLQWPRP